MCPSRSATTRVDSVTLTVFSRNYCHLCTEMVAGLREMQADFHFRLDIVDVDAQPELEDRYGDRVPVLACAGDELCHFHLDRRVVADYLTKIC